MPGVLLVLTSAIAAVVGYSTVSVTAARVLAPLPVWLTIASALVFDIWRLNNASGRYPLYPTKGYVKA